MRIAHVCTSCGHDLSNLRAPPDPVYALPLVVCPGCRIACVRRCTLQRWHPRGLWLPGIAGLRLALSSLVLLAVCGATAGLIVLNASIIRATLLAPPPPRSTRLAEWNAEYGPLSLGILVLAPIAGALLLRWNFAHLRPRARLGVWLIGVVALLWVLPSLFVTLDYLFSVPVRYLRFASERREGVRLELELGPWLWPALLALFAIAMHCAVPLADRFGGHVSRRRLSVRLARARRRRRKGRS